MSDLVERLRERTKLKYIAPTKTGDEHFVPLEDVVNAADAIDMLRALVSRLGKVLEPMRDIADAALSEAPADATVFKVMTSAGGGTVDVKLADLRLVVAAIDAVKQEGFL